MDHYDSKVNTSITTIQCSVTNQTVQPKERISSNCAIIQIQKENADTDLKGVDVENCLLLVCVISLVVNEEQVVKKRGKGLGTDKGRGGGGEGGDGDQKSRMRRSI